MAPKAISTTKTSPVKSKVTSKSKRTNRDMGAGARLLSRGEPPLREEVRDANRRKRRARVAKVAVATRVAKRRGRARAARATAAASPATAGTRRRANAKKAPRIQPRQARTGHYTRRRRKRAR